MGCYSCAIVQGCIRAEQKHLYMSSVPSDLQWGEEQGSGVFIKGMEKQQTPGAVLSWGQISKTKQQKQKILVCCVGNNNAGATISMRGRKSFLVWTALYLLEGEEERGQRPGRMCFLPPFNCSSSY